MRGSTADLPQAATTGRVINLFGAPLVGVAVTAAVEGRVVARARTHDDGGFSMMALPPERIVLSANSPGFRRGQVLIQLTRGLTVRVDLTLDSLAHWLLEEGFIVDLFCTTVGE